MSRFIPAAARLRRAWRAVRNHPRRVRAAALALALLLLGLAIAVPFLSAAEGRHLSGYGDGIRDVSVFRADLEARGATVRATVTSPHLLDALTQDGAGLLLVLGVERAFSEGEIDRIVRFVDAGGALVLADDVGHGNGLASRFGVVFSPLVVYDDASKYRGDSRLVVAGASLDGPPVDASVARHRLLFNAPALLATRDPKVEILSRSSNDSFIDSDGNKVITEGEQVGPFDLVARKRHGNGTVLLFADPGVFTNEAYEIPAFDNAKFLQELLAPHLSDGLVIVEESRHLQPPATAAPNGLVRSLVLASSSPAARILLVVFALTLVAAAAYFGRETEDWSKHVFDLGHDVPAPEDLVATPDRLQALARRAISESFNVPTEYLTAMSREDLVRVTGDPALAAAATGGASAADAAAVLRAVSRSVEERPS